MIVESLIFLLLVSVIPSNTLLCYECGCDRINISACHCNSVSNSSDNDYCVITEQRYTDTTYVQLSRIPRNSTWIYIEDPYYILTQESIRYNLSNRDWYLWTTGVVFGCDWNMCNTPNLIDSLPDSFKLSIDKDWLDRNIYGTGTVNECHHCPSESCGDNANPIDFTQCPLTTCINATTCLAFDLWNNIETNEQCYQSQCAPDYLNGEYAETLGGKYRIDIETIVYLAQNRSKYDIWEIDVYCGAYNCTRPTIFEEITGQLSIEISNLSPYPTIRPTTTQRPLVTSEPIENPLTCYSCQCTNTPTCSCSSTVVVSIDYTYCIIMRENLGQNVNIELGALTIDITDYYVREWPFVFVEEAINYDERGGRWFTTSNLILYGCNWNLCNKPELVPLLPNSFQMRLPETWLNSSILGTGQPVRDCHECPAGPQCGTIDFLDANVCPIQPCNTTCRVSDTFSDPDSDFFCYQSFCISSNDDQLINNHHRVEIEGIIYASRQNVVELWEIDLYCRADNCSYPGIFNELKQQLTIQVGTLAALFNETHDPTIPQRRCYDCDCYNELSCNCETTTIMSANSTYCIIIRENFGQDFWITLGHIDQDSTQVNIRDFPYLLIEESILYSEQTGRWNTLTNFVIYGCDWDYCNHPSLTSYLPNSFQMRLPETWLNESVLGTGQPARECHECPDAPQCGATDFLDVGRCPIETCNTTCLVSDTFNDPADGLLCYQSYCVPTDQGFEVDRHRIEIEGILYLDIYPRAVELWEVDIFCQADDCSRPEIFKELQSQLILQIGDLSAFNSTSPITTSTTVTELSTSNVSILITQTLLVYCLHQFFLSVFIHLYFCHDV